MLEGNLCDYCGKPIPSFPSDWTRDVYMVCSECLKKMLELPSEYKDDPEETSHYHLTLTIKNKRCCRCRKRLAWNDRVFSDHRGTRAVCLECFVRMAKYEEPAR